MVKQSQFSKGVKVTRGIPRPRSLPPEVRDIISAEITARSHPTVENIRDMQTVDIASTRTLPELRDMFSVEIAAERSGVGNAAVVTLIQGEREKFAIDEAVRKAMI